MSTNPTSIYALIDRWDTIREFALAIGCGYEAARQMRYRGRICPTHWDSCILAAEAKGIEGVTTEWLHGQHLNPTPLDREAA